MQDETPTFVSDFSIRLRALIKQRLGGVHAELARRAELTTAAIANYTHESPEKARIPKSLELYRLSRVLGVSMEYLLTGEDSDKNPPPKPPPRASPVELCRLAKDAKAIITTLENELKKF
jgi:transcriptional regulator with XRE-family HTH domain